MTAIVIILLLLIILPIIAFHFIKPDGSYHCSIPGCNRSFELLGNFIEHLKTEHDYSDEMIEDIINIISH